MACETMSWLPNNVESRAYLEGWIIINTISKLNDNFRSQDQMQLEGSHLNPLKLVFVNLISQNGSTVVSVPKSIHRHEYVE